MVTLLEKERRAVNEVGTRDAVCVSMCVTWKYTDAFN